MPPRRRAFRSRPREDSPPTSGNGNGNASTKSGGRGEPRDYTLSLNLSKSFDEGTSPPTPSSAADLIPKKPNADGTENKQIVFVLPSGSCRKGDDAIATPKPSQDQCEHFCSPPQERKLFPAQASETIKIPHDQMQQGLPLPPPRKGKMSYTSVVDRDASKSPSGYCAEMVEPLIRRRVRVRIGRPFSARSPVGWTDPYLSTPVRNGAEDNSDLYMPDIDFSSGLSIPTLSPENALRRRRHGDTSKGDNGQHFRTNSNGGEYLYFNVTDNKLTAETSSQTSGLIEGGHQFMSFSAFRINYLIVHIAIMLADGLQGTHLYVLYEGYGYSVASLYCLGFLTGAITSPFIGPFVDKIGRKKAAMLYCSLEMFINWLEQFPYFYGLIVSRVIGGITTNLLFSVFESWLVTEHRRRGYAEGKLETILRDSVILSNLAAIASGFLAEFLAMKFGPVGPFEGAVTCTAIALVLVSTMWRENYGSDVPGVQSVRGYMASAFETIVTDTNISRIGLIQGLTEGSLQTFVFLWSPALARFAANAPSNVLGLDGNGEPAYGLIFGAFMACGVGGGLSEPYVRRVATYLVRDHDRRAGLRRRDTIIIDGEGEVKPAAVEFLATGVYLACAGLLLVPYLLPADGKYSFSISLLAFLVYEFMVGLYMPCEGVIRSIYMPTSSVCSVMTMLRVIVNIAVALGVISTNYVPFTTAFAAVSTLMLVSAGIQLSMVDSKEWRNFVRRVSSVKSFAREDSRNFRTSLHDIPESPKDKEHEDTVDDLVPDCQPVSRDTSLLSTITGKQQ